MLNALLVDYQREQKATHVTAAKLAPDDLKSKMYAALREVCEVRLGRGVLGNVKLQAPDDRVLEVSEMVACLKRLRKSVQTWTKREGRRGYLAFVGEYT